MICKISLKFNIPNSYIQMGNTSQTLPATQQPTQPTTVEHPHLATIQNTNHPKYGTCCKKTYHFADEMMGQEKIRRCNARMKKFANSEYILDVKAVELIPKQQMCSNNCEVHVYFQKYTQSLRSIMNNRFKQKRVFTQQEIYQFVRQVLQALIFQQDNGFKNCHLDKDSIIICGSKVKLIDMGIATSTPYQTFLDKQMPIQGFYLAPELLKDLKDRNYEPYISPKSDIFCLGMIVLELACMESLDSYYDYENSYIDYESLIHRVSRIVYSVQLKTLIAGMLEYEPELRLGLISAQDKIRKALHIEQEQSVTAKRSRSSSTKMLKQLLTNSRRTITASHRDDDNKSLTKKPSNSSLTSMASMNSRYSQSKAKDEKDKLKRQHYRKQSQLYPTKVQTSALRDLIKNKIQSRISGQRSIIDSNKQNNNKSVNKDIEQDFKQNMKLIQHARSQNFGSNSTFLASYQYQFNKYSATPKINQPVEKLSSNYRKQESIFRLIQEDESFNSGKPSQNNCNTTINGPELSPVPPMIPQVQETNSIKRSTPVEQVIQQVTQFDEENIEQPIIICHDNQHKCINIEKYSPEPSMSLRVKKSLDKMYKTTQSISSSEQKQQRGHNRVGNPYKKLVLSNGYYYEGEFKEGGIFQGNGVLYNPQGQMLYRGSWMNGLFDGYGESYNLQANTARIDMRNFNQNPKNWLKYEGEFSKGKREGFGTIYYANGQRFSGCMRNDQINGYGCFYNNTNEMTSGIWVNNRLQH